MWSATILRVPIEASFVALLAAASLRMLSMLFFLELLHHQLEHFHHLVVVGFFQYQLR